MYDDRTKVQLSQTLERQTEEVDTNKNQMGLGEIYERQFKNSLGVGISTTD